MKFLARFAAGLSVAFILGSAPGCLSVTDAQLDRLFQTELASNLLARIETRMDAEIEKELRLAEAATNPAVSDAEADAGDSTDNPGPVASGSAPSASDPFIDTGKAKWIGPNGSKARVSAGLSNLTMDGKAFRYSPDKATEAWEPHQGEKNVNQYACAFFWRNGKWTGGKFDFSTFSRKSRPVGNLENGYIKGILPIIAGEKVGFCLLDLDCQNITVCPTVEWK